MCFVFGELFEAPDGDVRNGNSGAGGGDLGKNAAGAKGQEVVAVVTLAGGPKGDGSEGACPEVVGCPVKDLDVGAEFEFEGGIVDAGRAGNDGCRAGVFQKGLAKSGKEV